VSVLSSEKLMLSRRAAETTDRYEGSGREPPCEQHIVRQTNRGEERASESGPLIP
jgi:hypothetical protein